jgi:hypothetical protein
VGRRFVSGPDRTGAPTLEPILQPLKREPAVLPHDEFTVYVGYHICLINGLHSTTDHQREWFRGEGKAPRASAPGWLVEPDSMW